MTPAQRSIWRAECLCRMSMPMPNVCAESKCLCRMPMPNVYAYAECLCRIKMSVPNAYAECRIKSVQLSGPQQCACVHFPAHSYFKGKK